MRGREQPAITPAERVQTRAGQLAHLDVALRYVRASRRAIDVGAHTGWWSERLAQRFKAVTAFEPVDKYRARWMERMAPHRNAEIHGVALADRPGRAILRGGGGAEGHTKPFIVFDDAGNVMVTTLDAYGFVDVDLLKIDVEGADALVIAGAVRTIAQSKPVVIVESMPVLQSRFGLGGNAVPERVAALGGRLVAELWPDLVYVFD